MGCNISMVLKEYRNGSYLILNTVTIPFQLLSNTCYTWELCLFPLEINEESLFP